MPSPPHDLRRSSPYARFLSAGMLSLLLAGAANAQDSTISITGEVMDTTCEITPATRDQVVTLPPISARALRAVGDTEGETPFQLDLVNCPAPMDGRTAQTHFTSAANIDTGTNNLRAYLTPANPGDPLVAHQTVQIELTDQSSNKIKLGAAAGAQNIPDVTIASGRATIHFIARYIKTVDAPTAAGRITTSVNFEITYP